MFEYFWHIPLSLFFSPLSLNIHLYNVTQSNLVTTAIHRVLQYTSKIQNNWIFKALHKLIYHTYL